MLDNKKEIKNYNDEIITLKKEEKIIKQSRKYICKIYYENKKGTGFLCKIPYPDKFKYIYVLMTNDHVVNRDELIFEQLKITFDDDKIEKIINIDSERIIYSNDKNEYDITIIEIFPEKDNIFHFLEIDIIINKNINESIYIIQYPNAKNMANSYGKIKNVEGFYIYNDCSTEKGSSGSPIFLLKNYKIIGIHRGFDKDTCFNIGTLLEEPINEFKKIFSNKKKINKNNYINCIFCTYSIKDEDEFNLLHDFNKNITTFDVELELYHEGKKKKKLLEENIKIYIDDQPIEFNFKYKVNENTKYDMFCNNCGESNSKGSKYCLKCGATIPKTINVKFIFKEKFNDLSFLFFECKYIKTIDLSPFDAIDVTNMCYMFSECESLESIDFFSFNTSNVTNMRGMFSKCNSIKSIDLSSFNTRNVKDMSKMFFGCSSIKILDLTSFNTINLTNMNQIFANCISLKFLYLSSFNTINVSNMGKMFSKCSSLKSLDLSSFNTSNVIDMVAIFEYCSSLEHLDISLFNTNKVKKTNIKMFLGCNNLKNIKCKDQTILNYFETRNVFY